MEISGENYSVVYDPSNATITCKGSLRLYGTEGYAEVMALFNEVVEQDPDTITLKLHDLQFLNSSGINTLSKFVIQVRNQKGSHLVVRGTHKFPWQGKSLKNLQRLMPDLQLVLE